eukprot:Trichotokara_eunicae@DN5789_c0_g1_i3.p1
MSVRQPDGTTEPWTDFVVRGCGIDLAYEGGVLSVGTEDSSKITFMDMQADDVFVIWRDPTAIRAYSESNTDSYYVTFEAPVVDAECTHFMIESDIALELSFESSVLPGGPFDPTTEPATEPATEDGEEPTEGGGVGTETAEVTVDDETDGDAGGGGSGAASLSTVTLFGFMLTLYM